MNNNEILLHACCGPCSITPIARLRDLGLAPTLFWYNPNIHPLTEYLRRREGLREVAQRLSVPVIWADAPDAEGAQVGHGVSDAKGAPGRDEMTSAQGPDAAYPAPWLAAVAALGAPMADMAARCPLCYDLRLARAAEVARRLGFGRFSTTLLYSKYQNHQAILDAGARRADAALAFVGEDFRSGWDEGVRLSKEWGIYRQPYCGCLLSEHDRYRKQLLRTVAESAPRG